MRIIPRLLTVCFVVFWTLFVLLDYWQKHPSYYHSLARFQYFGMAVALLAIGGFVSWMVLKLGKDKRHMRYFNGVAVFVLFLMVSMICTGAAYNQMVDTGSFDAGRALHVVGMVGGNALSVLLIVTAAYVLGSFINQWLGLKLAGMEASLAAVAAGIMGLVLLGFLLGTVSLLHAFVLYPCLAALLILGRKRFIPFLKSLLWDPLASDKQLNWVGTASFYLLVVLFSINFTAVNVPMPAGFDSLTVYANLPSLIGGRHGLVEGFQPYNWSILMSLGYVLFDSTAVSLALSNLGGVLAAFAMYVLCRNWLNMNANGSLLAVLLFSLTPSITIQSSAELKIDLGLLFVSLVMLLVLLNYISNTSGLGGQMSAKTSSPGKQTTLATSENRAFAAIPAEIIWIGLMSGFALGIKLTTTYFAFALLAALWYARHGRRGFWAVFLASLSLVFMAKLDEFGGLRQFHLSVGLLQWALLLAACLLLAGVFLANKSLFQNSVKYSLLYGVFAILTFLPWAIKNFSETGSLSPTALMNGKAATPDISLPVLEQNLQQNAN